MFFLQILQSAVLCLKMFAADNRADILVSVYAHSYHSIGYIVAVQIAHKIMNSNHWCPGVYAMIWQRLF